MNKIHLKYNPKIALLNIIGDYMYNNEEIILHDKHDIVIDMAIRLQRIIYNDLHEELVAKIGKNLNPNGELYMFQIADIGYDIEDGTFLITIDEEDCVIYELTNAYLV